METFVPQGRKDAQRLAAIDSRLDALLGTSGDSSLAASQQLRAGVALAVQSVAEKLTPAQLMGVSTLFEEWAVGGSYSTGQILRYSGGLWQVLQAVTGAQADHTPDKATSLYKRIGEPDSSGVFPWVQPLGATDAYAKGAKVTHNGKTWVSDVDANVWEPGVYGWTAQ